MLANNSIRQFLLQVVKQNNILCFDPKKVGTFVLYYPTISAPKYYPTNCLNEQCVLRPFRWSSFRISAGTPKSAAVSWFSSVFEAHSNVYLKLGHNYLFLFTSHFVTGMRRITTFRSTTDLILDGGPKDYDIIIF